MATIDLGKIKLVWRGTYSGSTAYTVDDVVQHTDTITSSFICTTASTGNAPSTGGSVHGSWAYLAKGAAGSVLTTQGDILYRDGSGDQRLAKGTGTQQLAMNSGATAPEWVDASGGKILQMITSRVLGSYTQAATSTHTMTTDGSTTWTQTITPTATTSQIWHILQIGRMHNNTSTDYYGAIQMLRDGTAEDYTRGSQTGHGERVTWWVPMGTNYSTQHFTLMCLDKPETTSAVAYTMKYWYHNTSAYTFYFNRSASGSTGRADMVPMSNWMTFELDAVTGA